MGKNPPKHCLSPVLIVGSKNSGKTSYLDYLIQRAKQQKLQVAGFLSRGKLSNGKKNQYFLEDIHSGKHYLLANQTPGQSESISYGGYYFDPGIFELGKKLLLQNPDADVIVLDEFGPLEVRGEGFREAFDRILDTYHGIFLIAVRPSLLPELENILKQTRKKNPDRNFLRPKNSQ